MLTLRRARAPMAVLCCVIGLSAAAAPAKRVVTKDPLEPARAALRTLQFDKAIALLGAMYLNGVGLAADPPRGRTLLQSAAEHGQGPAAYVLAGELARDKDAPP